MHLRRIQARIASSPSPDITDPPPPFVFAPAEFQRACAPPEELLAESCFDRGGGEVVGYENGDEPVRLDAGDVREQ